MESLDVDVRKSVTLPGQPDDFSRRYEIIENVKGKNYRVIYPSYELETVDAYLFRLLYESTPVDFKNEWTMRPDYTSYDMYGTVIFWYIILYVNFIPSIEDYKGLDFVIIPHRGVISDMIGDKVPRNLIEKDDASGIFSSHELRLFLKSKRKSADDVSLNKIGVLSNVNKLSNVPREKFFIETEPYEYTQEVVLDSEMITSKNINFSRVPYSDTSVVVYINNIRVPLRLGYDYIVLKKGNRYVLSWSSLDAQSLSESILNKVLRVDMKVSLRYFVR